MRKLFQISYQLNNCQRVPPKSSLRPSVKSLSSSTRSLHFRHHTREFRTVHRADHCTKYEGSFYTAMSAVLYLSLSRLGEGFTSAGTIPIGMQHYGTRYIYSW